MTYKQHARAVLVLGLPLIGSHLAQMAIGVTDTIMVGWYDVNALAALVLAGSYFFMIAIFGSGFANAVMPLVAEAAGSGETQRVRRVTRMGLWMSLGFSVVSAPLFYSSGAVLRALGQDAEIAELAQIYLRIAGFGLAPMLLVMVLKSYLAALERTAVLLWVTIGASVLNGLVNYALIFGNWGFPELGIEGAAIASVFTQMLSLVLLLIYAGMATPEHTLFQRFWRPDFGAMGAVFGLGWPIGLALLSEMGLFVAAAIMVGWIGTMELAAHGVAIQLSSVTFMVHLGLSGVATVRAGRALGRGDEAGLKDGGRVVLAMSVAFSVVTVAVFLIFPEPLIGLFIDPHEPLREEIIAIGVLLIAMAALFQLADGFQAIAIGLLRGVLDTKVPMVFATVSYWGIGLPVAYVLSQGFGYGAPGVWMGLVFGLSCAAVLLNLRFWRRPPI